jgi:hypothetical protein
MGDGHLAVLGRGGYPGAGVDGDACQVLTGVSIARPPNRSSSARKIA